MSSFIARASGECSIQQVKFKHEKTHIQVPRHLPDQRWTRNSAKYPQPTRSQHWIQSSRESSCLSSVQHFNNIISGCTHKPTSKLLDNKTNFKFQLKSLKHGSRAQQTTLKSATENYRSRNNVYPPLKPATFLFFGREPNTQQTAVRMNLTIAANAYPFKLYSNAANNI